MDPYQEMRAPLGGQRHLLGFFAILLLSHTCAGGQPSRSVQTNEPEFLRCVNPTTQSKGECMGLIVKQVGQGKLVHQEAEQPVPHRRGKGVRQPHEVSVDNAKYGSVSMRAFNARTRRLYEVTLSQELLDRIRREREARGLNQASESVKDPDAVERTAPRKRGPAGRDGDRAAARTILVTLTENASWPRLQLTGRSNGDDSRIVLTPTTVYPWRTIARFSDVCSGTLIGPRLLITAAHCLNQQGTTIFYDITVAPGSDGIVNGKAVSPYGTSETLAPGPTWYWTSAQWQQCDPDPDEYDDCEQYDWGFLVIPNPLGKKTGWMGFAAQPGSTLNSVHHLNRGYPACASKWGFAVPVNCQPFRLYGDMNWCALGDYSNEDPDGWNRNIEHGCDTSPGQSGSPLYYYGQNQNGQLVPIVTMVNISSRCDDKGLDPCQADDDTPNKARRITPSVLGVINWGLQTFP